MPTERRNVGKPRRTPTLVSAASTSARGTRNANGHERDSRAALELMREIGYAHPAAIGEFFDQRGS